MPYKLSFQYPLTETESRVTHLMCPKYEAEGKTLEIDNEKCTGCGSCADVCPSDVFEIVEGKSTAPNVAECIECCACVSGCPEEAIKHNSC